MFKNQGGLRNLQLYSSHIDLARQKENKGERKTGGVQETVTEWRHKQNQQQKQKAWQKRLEEK